MAGSTDPLLIDISNSFYTGSYQQCINLCEKIKVKLNFVVGFKFQLIQFQF